MSEASLLMVVPQEASDIRDRLYDMAKFLSEVKADVPGYTCGDIDKVIASIAEPRKRADALVRKSVKCECGSGFDDLAGEVDSVLWGLPSDLDAQRAGTRKVILWPPIVWSPSALLPRDKGTGPMTDLTQTLDRLEALLVKAMAGPWDVDYYWTNSGTPDERVYGMLRGPDDMPTGIIDENEAPDDDTLPHDLALIVEAVNALPTLIASVRALLAEREWRPIETAPKDGTRALLLHASDLVTTGGEKPKPYPVTGAWRDYHAGAPDWRSDSGMKILSDWWQPLPPSPEKEA